MQATKEDETFPPLQGPSCGSLFPRLSAQSPQEKQYQLLPTIPCLPKDQWPAFFWKEKRAVALLPSSTKLMEPRPSGSAPAQGSVVPASGRSWHHQQPCPRASRPPQTTGRLRLWERRVSLQVNHPTENSNNTDDAWKATSYKTYQQQRSWQGTHWTEPGAQRTKENATLCLTVGACRSTGPTRLSVASKAQRCTGPSPGPAQQGASQRPPHHGGDKPAPQEPGGQAGLAPRPCEWVHVCDRECVCTCMLSTRVCVPAVGVGRWTVLKKLWPQSWPYWDSQPKLTPSERPKDLRLNTESPRLLSSLPSQETQRADASTGAPSLRECSQGQASRILTIRRPRGNKAPSRTRKIKSTKTSDTGITGCRS